MRVAIGLAAVGAGILVARMLRGRRGEEEAGPVAVAPPEPDKLIGAPRSHKSAERSAEILDRPERPV